MIGMIGETLTGRYQIQEILSSGAFGQTYLAIDTHRPGSPLCVVKQLQPPLENTTLLKTSHRLFKQEAETLEKLGKHPQIPQLLAYFEDHSEFYLVEEFIPGHPLSAELKTGHPLPETQVMQILQEIVEILVFVHSQGAIHRDVNPSNLIRRQTDQRLVLIDFGSVKEVQTQMNPGQASITRTVATGTPAYMPIEQFQGNPQFNSDLYAAGMIAIQALTGLPGSDLPKLHDTSSVQTGKMLWRQRATVSPALAEVIDRMVHTHYGQRYQSAQEVLDQLQKLSPTASVRPSRLLQPWQWGLLGLGACLVIGGGYLWLNRADPSQAQVYLQRGLQQAKEGNRAGAIANFSQAIQLHPQDPQAYYQRGNLYADQQDFTQAIADYTQALARNPQWADAYYNRGLARLDAGDFTGAVEDYSRFIQLRPNDGEAYYKRGNAYFNLKQFPAALADYNQAIRLNGQDINAYQGRGLTYSALEQPQPAIADFTQVIRLQPQNTDAYYSRGRARFHVGDYPGALNDYSVVIRLNPKDPEAFVNRCSTHLNLGQIDSAIADCRQAIQLDPQNEKAYSNQCVAYLKQQQSAQAIGSCQKTLELNPKNDKAFSNLGLAYLAAGQLEQSIQQFDQAIRLNPSDSVAYSNRGSAYEKSGNLSQAIADLTQAIRLNPNFAAAYANRAEIRSKLGDRSGAIADLQTAAKLYLDQGQLSSYQTLQKRLQNLP